MKVSKVVMLVVALHVLVIGGIFVFEGCSRAKAPTPDLAANETAPAEAAAANAVALPADPAATQSLSPAQPVAATAIQPTHATPVAPARTYTVKKGDTLWKIAKTERVTIGELARANNLTQASTLKLNQKLQIPTKAEAPSTTVVTVQPAATAVDATAPVPATSGNTYAVKAGDSLWKIAKANNVSVAALKQANKLTSDSLKLDQKLMIPAAATTAAAPIASAGISTASYSEWQPGAVTENGQRFHIVDVGESLGSIAKKYSVTVSELMKANNITDAKRIMVTQKLVIPAANTAPTTSATPAVAAPMITTLN